VPARAVSQAGGEAALPLGVQAGPGRPARRCEAGAWRCGRWGLGLEHHEAWRGPCAGASLAPAEGRPRCCTIARTPRASFTDPSTRGLPAHLTQANTSKANVLLSNSAQSTRGVFCFIGSLLAAAWPGAPRSPPPLPLGDQKRLVNWTLTHRDSPLLRPAAPFFRPGLPESPPRGSYPLRGLPPVTLSSAPLTQQRSTRRERFASWDMD
jgi:hypothetical protein